MRLVSLEDVRVAAERIQGRVTHTPLVAGPPGPVELMLKPESLQPVGSFKLRGATNALARLSPRQRQLGVVTHSSGNHGRALAQAARTVDARCVVVVPQGAAEVKVAAIRAAGAEVVVVPPADRLHRARQIAESSGMALVPPFDHPDIIAGQGTVGWEIASQAPDVEVVVVPVGGGGLAAGTATALRSMRPEVTVVGVEPELAGDAAQSLATGRLTVWPPGHTGRTVADGLRTGLSELTFAHLCERLDDIVTVREDEIRTAVRRLATEARLVAEPSGAVATAAVLGERTPPGRTVAVVSGGNVDLSLLREVLA
ncbi:threonine/serine dehydratase [Lipingzhangella sp. LS1_29]|uniref:Threonine/serine dehydratase n=1 Tax=Lipingzhangella rawalii TaxID=2055835 RepID=A0ABU2H1Y3_9ACTN|nr:threonine/serine dehydratase [Lipingzhangella rawalii]MDS1269012.1 threonine/serine dehydratase [Lipingzhangella rawalii]